MVNGNNDPIRTNLEKFRISHEKERKQRIDNFERLVNSQLKNKLQRMRVSPDEVQVPSGASISEENKVLRKALDARIRPVARPAVAPVTTPTPTPSPTGLPPISPPPTPRQSRGGVRTPMGRIPAPVVGAGRQFLREAVRGGLNLMGMVNVTQPIMAARGKTLTEATRERLPEPIRWRPPEKPGEGTGAFLADIATGGMSYLPTEAERREDPVGSLIKSGTVAGGFVLGPVAKGAYKVARPMLAPVARAARPALAPVARAARAPLRWAERRTQLPKRGVDEDQMLLGIDDEKAIAKAIKTEKKPTGKIPVIKDEYAYRPSTLSKLEHLTASVRHPNFLKRFSEKIGGGRYGGVVARLIDPTSGAAKNEAAEVILGFEALKADMSAELSYQLAKIKALYFIKGPKGRLPGRMPSVPIFDISEEGKVLLPVKSHNLPKVENGRIAYGDALESPVKYFRDGTALGEQRIKFVKEASKLNDAVAIEYEKLTGETVRTLLSGPKREHHWPRFRKDLGKFEYPGKLIGGKAGSLKKRIIEEMGEGQELGIDYGRSPIADAEQYLKAFQRMTADAIFKKQLLKKKIIRTTPATEGQKQLELFAKGKHAGHAGERLKKYRTPYYATKTEYGKELSRLSKDVNVVLRKLEKLGGVARFVQTGTLDFAQFSLQLAVLFAYSPNRWAKTVKAGAKAFLDPETMNQAVRSNPKMYRNAARHNIDIGLASELVKEEQWIRGWQKKIPILPALQGYARRFAASFNTALAVGRVEMFDGMQYVVSREAEKHGVRNARGTIIKYGQKGFEEALDQELGRLGRAVNTMLGTTETIGMSATQRSIENGILFFSPRYTRSVFGTISHMLGTGYTNREVRWVMGKFLAGGVATYTGLAYAHSELTGRDFERSLTEGINPRSGKKFMSLPVGGVWVGMGGAYRSTIQLAATLSAIEKAGLASEGESAWNFRKSGRGGYYEQAFFDNPLTQYVRGRSSPVGGTLMDWIDQEDFIGKPFPGLSPSELDELGMYGLKRISPFSVSALTEVLGSPALEETSVMDKTARAGMAMGAEALFGARTSPVKWWEHADDISRQTLGTPWKKIEAYQRRDIENMPEVARMKRETKSYGYYEEEARLKQERENAYTELSQRVGQLSNWDVYQAYIEINDTYSGGIDEAKKDHGDPYAGKDPKNVNEQDISDYYAIHPNLKPGQTFAEGVSDFYRTLLLQPGGSERYKYVVRNTNLTWIPTNVLSRLPRSVRERRAVSDRGRRRHRAGLD